MKAKISEMEQQARDFRARLNELSNRRKSLEKQLERKARAHRLYTTGGLVEKAGISLVDFDKDILLGAFLWLGDHLKDRQMMIEFAESGKVVSAN
jgi:hypothetical protein